MGNTLILKVYVCTCVASGAQGIFAGPATETTPLRADPLRFSGCVAHYEQGAHALGL